MIENTVGGRTVARGLAADASKKKPTVQINLFLPGSTAARPRKEQRAACKRSSPNAGESRVRSSGERKLLLVAITLHELDEIPLGITKENDPTTRDVFTDVGNRIGFNAVGPQ
jgi:hypothetical protein